MILGFNINTLPAIFTETDLVELFSCFPSLCSEGVAGADPRFTTTITREKYANMYGPTTGDKLRLGDTSLYARIEKDYTVYGDECVFGGGKVIREGMGQGIEQPEIAPSLDTVITNCVVIDYIGIFKADIGIKNGYIVGLGKAGNPDTMHGVKSNMLIGVIRNFISLYKHTKYDCGKLTSSCSFS